MKGQQVGYIRVSSVDQNTERQLDGVQLDKVFTDKASGKDTNRPQLQAAMEWTRAGDTLLVHSMDRLARNVEDMLRIVRELNGKGVTVQFIKENMIFTAGKDDPRANLMFAMLGAFAQFERSLIRERQREGIEIAKAKGVYKGKQPKLKTEQLERLRYLIDQGVPKAQVARKFNISRETLYRILREQTDIIDDNQQRTIPGKTAIPV